MKKIGKFLIGRDHQRFMNAEELRTVDELYEKKLKEGKKLILGTLSARSGTMWLCDIFEAHKNATGATERNAVPESFLRYITYNKLPIDISGNIKLIKQGIVEDWERGDIALVFSPYFSHAINELNRELKPDKFIIGINDPEFTVQSIHNKGFFRHPYSYKSPDKAYGYQPGLGEVWSHLFGRIIPTGDFYQKWEKLTRIGKISWWVNKVTTDIYKQIQDLPKEKIFYFHLKEADQNYNYYKKIATKFSLEPLLNEKSFLNIKSKRFKKKQNEKHVWSNKEREEFELYTKEYQSLYKKIYNLH